MPADVGDEVYSITKDAFKNHKESLKKFNWCWIDVFKAESLFRFHGRKDLVDHYFVLGKLFILALIIYDLQFLYYSFHTVIQFP